MDTALHKLSKKTLVVLIKIIYENVDTMSSIDLHDINKALKKTGISTNLNLDVTFIYELYILNEKNLINKTLNVENIEIPELKSVDVRYYEIRSETITYYYNVNLETFTTKKQVVDNFFRYDGDDYIDITYMDSQDRDYGDSETHESGIDDITEK